MQPFALLWEAECDASIISVATTPNFSLVCAGTVGKSVYLFRGDGSQVWDSPFPVDNEVWAVAMSTDGRYIAVGTANKDPADGTLYVITADRQLFWSQRIRAPIWGVSLSADGATLVASTWLNNAFIFRRQGIDYIEDARPKIPGDSGLYGARLTSNGELCVIASYDRGLFLVQGDGGIPAFADHEGGLYNVAIASGVNRAFVGTSGGTFLACNLDDDRMTLRASQQLSQRPLCGLSVAENGNLIAAGSFDGRVIVSSDQGDPLWDFQTKGEVWATAISTNGALVCAGSGDQRLRTFRNLCDTSAYEEVVALEKAVSESASAGATTLFESLTSLYLKYGLATYGYHRLERFVKNHAAAHVVRGELRKFLEATVDSDVATPESHFYLAQLLANDKEYFEAIRHFQMASAASPGLRSSAQRKAAECFTELRYATAATSAWRQSREQHLDDNARQVLFMLARSYEDGGEWREAAKIYEMILSWDADFRNSADRLQLTRSVKSSRFSGAERVDKDYTGNTTSLLGPDAARNVDKALDGVLKARHRDELLIHPGDRQQVGDTVKDLISDEAFSRGIKREVEKLDYNLQLFLKYDFGLPEDEMKKFLETVNAFPLFKNQLKRSVGGPLQSLDIGSATGRYPSLLKRLGFEAYGIDIEQRAIEYSVQKTKNADWPKFVCGDACHLDQYLDETLRFNVITCMMGTFEHIPRNDQLTLISRIHSRLKQGGVAIISVWDVECPHLAYLSMYDENQKELIRQNGRTQREMVAAFKKAGFAEVSVLPFCMLPQTVIYDLGIERMEARDINIAAQADLAARALFSDRRGEMFLTIAYRQ